MSDATFTSPSLVGLNTKATQLEALQIVREGTTFQYKKLAEEDERIDKKLKLMIKASGRNTHSYFAGTDNGSENDGRRESTNHGNEIAYRGEHRTSDFHQYQHQPTFPDSIKSKFGARSYPVDKDRDISNEFRVGYGNSDTYQYQRQSSLAEGVLQAHKSMDSVQTRSTMLRERRIPTI